MYVSVRHNYSVLRRVLTIGLGSALVCLLLAVVVVPALAATVTFSGNNSPGLSDGMINRPTNCIGSFGFRHYKAHAFTVSADGNYTIRITSASFDTIISLYQNSFDANDPWTNCLTEDDDSGGNRLSLITHHLTAGTQYFLVVYGFGGSNGPYTGEITGPGSIFIDVQGGSTSAGAAAGPARRPDDRLNWMNGDDLAVIYSRDDDADNPAIHVYCVGENSEGVIGLVVTQADLQGIAMPPANNTLVASSTLCDVEFYVLTTGEYQINIRAESGKVFATVMADLAGTSAYGYMLTP